MCTAEFWWCLELYHHANKAQNIFSPPQTLGCLCVAKPSPPLAPATTNLSPVTMILPFPECRRNAVLRCVAFWVWLPSLSGVRGIHVPLHCRLVFHSMREPYFITQQPKDIGLFAVWDNYEWNCCKHSLLGSCINISFHVAWVNKYLRGDY